MPAFVALRASENERDHAALGDAVKNGRVAAETGVQGSGLAR